MFTYINFPSWIRPEVVSFLPIRWYAVMYIVAFAITYFLFRRQCKKNFFNKTMDSDTSVSLFCYVIIGLILGARLGSCLIYEGSGYYWTHPWMIFWPFRNGSFIGLPGMSYHGGVIGGIIGGLLFAKKYNFVFLDVADSLTVCIPLGYTFGRLGNFINGELWGRCTGSSYGMIFPGATRFSSSLQWVKDAAAKAGIDISSVTSVNLPRHPSQLYEAFFEGIIIFIILWFIIEPLSRKKGPGIISGSYFGLYGLFRFIIEYFREPDSQLGYILGPGRKDGNTALFESVFNISMGQILCFLMIIGGIFLIIHGFKTKKTVYKASKK